MRVAEHHDAAAAPFEGNGQRPAGHRVSARGRVARPVHLGGRSAEAQQHGRVWRRVDGLPAERVAITGVTIRDTPPEPFTVETVAELAAYRTMLETSMGVIELELLPDLAPVTVRRFLQMIAGGVYDGMVFHRVAANFVIQTGALFYRTTPLLVSQQRLVENLPPEFTQTPNVPGIVSMARGDDPGSGQTSFFVCIGTCTALTGQYTVFARVVGGLDVVNAIAGVPVNGETPVAPIVMTRVRAVKTP